MYVLNITPMNKAGIYLLKFGAIPQIRIENYQKPRNHKVRIPGSLERKLSSGKASILSTRSQIFLDGRDSAVDVAASAHS